MAILWKGDGDTPEWDAWPLPGADDEPTCGCCGAPILGADRKGTIILAKGEFYCSDECAGDEVGEAAE
ncbi:MAG: hypothetical protein JOZ73_11910 [Solirubrobacterales bacterium]|nr:hypothetical protein [Solirubrobacterales bacterium]